MKDVRFAAAFGGLLALGLATSAQAQVPEMMPYQGHIADDTGAYEGTATMTFRLYQTEDANGPVWTEVWDDVPVEGGMFQVYLGMFTPVGDVIATGRGRYLGIAIEGEGEATPRQPIGSVPFAVVAGDAETLGGFPAEEFITRIDLEGYVRWDVLGERGYVTWAGLDERGYVTDADLEGYASEQWVRDQGYVSADDLGAAVGGALDGAGYASEQWVRDNYLGNDALDGYASEQWVRDNYLGNGALDGYASEQWVDEQGFITADELELGEYLERADLDGYATEQWVRDGYLAIDGLEGYASEQWVRDQGYLTGDGVAEAISGYATEQWVRDQGYVTGDDLAQRGYLNDGDLDGYATEQWVQDQGYTTGADIDGRGYLTGDDLRARGYVTGAELDARAYLTAAALDGYATEAWVQGEGYLTAGDLGDYVTVGALDARGYVTQATLDGRNYVSQGALDARNYVSAAALDARNYVDVATLDDRDYANNAAVADLQAQIDALQVALGNVGGAYLLGRSAQSSNGRFSFNGQTGVRAANAMCQASYANEPTAHFCSPDEVFQAVTRSRYDQAGVATMNNQFTWTVADNVVANQGNNSINANCQNLLYNSGDVATGTRIKVQFGYQSNGNGGGLTGDIVQVQQAIGCGTNLPVLCCR